jgi:hypothetical protein
MTTATTIKLLFRLIFPFGGSLSFWMDKQAGPIQETIDGFSGQFWRDFQKIRKLRDVFRPYVSDFIPELEYEFFTGPGELTGAERRGRIDARFELMFDTKLRIELIEDILEVSGFPGVVIRTLGSNGTNESPYDFFTTTGLAYWGAEEAIWGAEEFIYGNVQTSGENFLITNGGSIEYSSTGYEAQSQLQPNPDYWGAYFIIEGAAGARLSIPERLRETFYDLLYLLKPSKMHGILRADFTT